MLIQFGSKQAEEIKKANTRAALLGRADELVVELYNLIATGQLDPDDIATALVSHVSEMDDWKKESEFAEGLNAQMVEDGRLVDWKGACRRAEATIENVRKLVDE